MLTTHSRIHLTCADIKQFFGNDVELSDTRGGKVFRVPRAETHPCDPSHLTDAEDIAGMNNMHEGPLLSLLERRYYTDAIYTFTGDILISINPYKGIQGLYSIPTGDLVDYREKKTPHVFAGALMLQ